jgi:hypothetical protein
MINFRTWLEWEHESENQINVVKNDIIKLLAGAGTSEGDALKINLAKKVKGNNGIKKGVKAVESILADNNIFNRLKQISPDLESKLRQSISRARPDYYELATLLKDTFGDPSSPKIHDREKPQMPTMPPKDSGSKFPKPNQDQDLGQMPPPAGQPGMMPPNPPMY